MTIRHDSRDMNYREPMGAQPAGTWVRMRLLLEGEDPVAKVLLRLWWDGREQMHLMGPAADGLYETKFPLPVWAGVLWYSFVIELGDGRTMYYGNAWDGLGGEGAVYEQPPPGYQVTVYDPSYEVPGWMGEGILYHIMVDRFCASKGVAGRPEPRGGHWHRDWYDDPELNLDPETTDNVASDFFGGDLKGIEQKLPYLRELGVSVLYLSPIFEATSNHKYDTGNYMRIDPSFGTEADFVALCAAAKGMGMRVMLDGVFSHTGADSLYFNRGGNYEGVGAHQSKQSPYYSWYDFANWPDEYDTWWGFDTLPVVKKGDPAFLSYLLRGKDSVFGHWLRAGASGWRLDVADELPMDMMREMRARMKAMPGEGALLGEVWEDASKKVAYGEMRSYCLGDTLDSTMNYPLRDAILDFLLMREDAGLFARRIASMQENYPKPFFYSLMNLMGSHDKPRAVNVLSEAFEMEPLRAERSPRKLPEAAYALGRARYLLAMQILMAMPGMPSIYYGDEAGAEGMSDPFCRGTYPWGREDSALIQCIRQMAARRRRDEVWTLGELVLHAPCADVLVIERTLGERSACCALNRAATPREATFGGRKITLPGHGMACWDSLRDRWE